MSMNDFLKAKPKHSIFQLFSILKKIDLERNYTKQKTVYSVYWEYIYFLEQVQNLLWSNWEEEDE